MTELTLKSQHTFRNRTAVVEWLKAKGYKIRKSKLYKDAKAGLLRVEDDGTVEMESVARYLEHPEAGVKEHMETVEAGSDLEIKEYHRRSAIAKAKKTELEVQQKQIEIDKESGRLIPADMVYREFAARLAVLIQALTTLIDKEAKELVRQVNGKPSREGEFKAELKEKIYQLFNEFSKTNIFDTMFEDD